MEAANLSETHRSLNSKAVFRGDRRLGTSILIFSFVFASGAILLLWSAGEIDSFYAALVFFMSAGMAYLGIEFCTITTTLSKSGVEVGSAFTKRRLIEWESLKSWRLVTRSEWDGQDHVLFQLVGRKEPSLALAISHVCDPGLSNFVDALRQFVPEKEEHAIRTDSTKK